MLAVGRCATCNVRMIRDVPRHHPLLVQFRDDPYPLYRYLLAAAPVQRNELLEAWTVARHSDVVTVLTDPRFSADRTGISPEGYEVAKSMLVSDPPDHTRLRTLVQKAFTPRMIDQLRPRIQGIVAELLDAALQRGDEFDVVADLAYPLPVIVIAELLGVPVEDRATFHDWSATLAASLDPVVSSDLMDRTWVARDALHAYLRGIIAQRRRQPKSDLISALVAVEERGDTLREPELVVMCTLLLIAGHETTVNLIGNGTLALLKHPDELARLRETPGLITTAIEELLRFDSPVQMTGRILTDTVELGGKVIEKGEFVLPLLGAANHDPLQFSEPERLDLTRNPNPHVAFGRGIHFCLGAPLARVEGQIAIGALLQRCPNLRLNGDPLRRDQITLRGLSSLPVAA
jgi:pimeloyl-[acyl-carrier protein] synthase